MRPHTHGGGRRGARHRRPLAGTVPRRARSPARVRGRRVLPDGRPAVPRRSTPTRASRSTRTASAWRASFASRGAPGLAGEPIDAGARPRGGLLRLGRRCAGARATGPTAGADAVRDALHVADRARRSRILTGEYGAEVLTPLLPALAGVARLLGRPPARRQPVLRRQHRGHRPADRRATSRAPSRPRPERHPVPAPRRRALQRALPRRPHRRRPPAPGRGRRDRRRVAASTRCAESERDHARTAAHRRRRRPAERRQVDAREPLRRQRRRDRRGEAGRHA